jgi:hypothetical protein
MTPEGIVKKQITAALKVLQEGYGVWYYMPVAGRFGVAGIPDIVGCTDGAMWAIEAKAATGKPTALQLRTLAAMAAAGARVGVVKPGEQSIAEQVSRIVMGEFHG